MKGDAAGDAELWFGDPAESVMIALERELAGGYRGHRLTYAGRGSSWMLTCEACGGVWALQVAGLGDVPAALAQAVSTDCDA